MMPTLTRPLLLIMAAGEGTVGEICAPEEIERMRFFRTDGPEASEKRSGSTVKKIPPRPYPLPKPDLCRHEQEAAEETEIFQRLHPQGTVFKRIHHSASPLRVQKMSFDRVFSALFALFSPVQPHGLGRGRGNSKGGCVECCLLRRQTKNALSLAAGLVIQMSITRRTSSERSKAPTERAIAECRA